MQSDTLSERATQTERVALSERVWPLLVVALGIGLTVAWVIFLADEIGRLFRTLLVGTLAVLLTLGVFFSILTVGFAIGYAVRAGISYRHRAELMRRRNI